MKFSEVTVVLPRDSFLQRVCNGWKMRRHGRVLSGLLFHHRPNHRTYTTTITAILLLLLLSLVFWIIVHQRNSGTEKVRTRQLTRALEASDHWFHLCLLLSSQSAPVHARERTMDALRVSVSFLRRAHSLLSVEEDQYTREHTRLSLATRQFLLDVSESGDIPHTGMTLPSTRRFAVAWISPPGHSHKFEGTFDFEMKNLRDGLVALGHDVIQCKMQECPPNDDRIAIVFGGNAIQHTPGLADDIPMGSFLVQLEQLASRTSQWSQGPYRNALCSGKFRILEYSRENREILEECTRIPDIWPFYFSLSPFQLFHPSIPEDIDVLLFGSTSPRRETFVALLKTEVSPSVVFLEDVYNPQLHVYVARARIIANVHHFQDSVTLESQRLFNMVTAGRFVVSEPGEPHENKEWACCVVFSALHDMPGVIRRYLSDPSLRDPFTQRGFQKLLAGHLAVDILPQMLQTEGVYALWK